MLSPILVAVLLKQIRPQDTGALPTFMQTAIDKFANMKLVQGLLPVVAGVDTLPLVPDGAVSGRPYIPLNTTADVVTNAAALAKSFKRTAAIAAGSGVAVGGLAMWILKRKRR